MTIEQRLLALAEKATQDPELWGLLPDDDPDAQLINACDPATVTALARVVEVARHHAHDTMDREVSVGEAARHDPLIAALRDLDALEKEQER